MKAERTLAPGEENAYSAKLESGGGIIANVDQDGVDVVIDVYAPDGKHVVQLDSPNGAHGPEPIVITALQSGEYRFVIHSLDKSGGKYVVSVDRILAPAENAKRLAREAYRTDALVDLWEASLTDARVVEKFAAEHEGKPIIEPLPNDATQMRVTFFCLGDDDTTAARQNGGADWVVGNAMRRFGRTNLFFTSPLVPSDARFEYSFSLVETHRAGPTDVQELVQRGPWLLEMPGAPGQPSIVAKDSVAKGTTSQTSIKSTVLNEDRTITVYTPAGYDRKSACDLLIVFDGITYGGGTREQAEVPTPTILDNLIAEKRIGPTIALLVWSMGKRNRDLTGNKAFADFIGMELVPWARAHYAIAPGAGNVVVAGSSFGGFAATFCAIAHPESIGNVLSQSGAYWITKDWQNVRPPYPHDTGMMIEQLKRTDHLPIRFYIEVGRFDLGAAMLGSNRELRDVLQTKGYDVDYREFDGGHEYAAWRGSLADGLVSLKPAHHEQR
jgi:enterochelin esterase family protein